MEASSKRVELIPAKRRALILERIRVEGAASIQALAEETGASISTIRRDLEQLTEEGYLERTHGGALLVPPLRATFEREPTFNAAFQHRQKQAIGAAAAQKIKAGESVIFDSSSTVMEAVRAALARDLALTAVTNNLDIAKMASEAPNWKVIVPGGTVRPRSSLIFGEPGEAFMQNIHPDLCIVGTYAVSGRLLTDASLEVASVKRSMIKAARRAILLADSSKFQAPAFCTFGEVSDIDEIITDEDISPEHLSLLRSLDVNVTVVPLPAEG
ncbi:DeoR/GlpR family DNA-binding transcription regulator [Consotaella salsifontis]|uniref:Transcriptional regulator, DeoR family n=1 Tax=Consotaella salsifontis TaxID=1365950 RepID=A0A1T4S6B5_9HYPH|nr:DeoR/GlpR family DNA-binding transcription regulator [Consotaella salsifontis]SKA23789.1 transcriptional regulator, DeoR family [Consotaella salsifontis]